MGGLVILCWLSSGRSTAYLSSFFVMASNGNLSLQNVNSKNWTFRFGFGENKDLPVGDAPMMYGISGRNHARHLQHGR